MNEDDFSKYVAVFRKPGGRRVFMINAPDEVCHEILRRLEEHPDIEFKPDPKFITPKGKDGQ